MGRLGEEREKKMRNTITISANFLQISKSSNHNLLLKKMGSFMDF